MRQYTESELRILAREDARKRAMAERAREGRQVSLQAIHTAEEEHIRAWVAQHCTVSPLVCTPAVPLYHAYRDAVGMMAYPAARFARVLSRVGYPADRMHGTRIYHGIQLNTAPKG